MTDELSETERLIEKLEDNGHSQIYAVWNI